jgi:mRNA-degrading endonuclease RelE of RelBE toxin-antitoxin system
VSKRAWRVEVTHPATRDIKRLDPPVRERVLAALDGLKSDPPVGDIKRLAGQRQCRALQRQRSSGHTVPTHGARALHATF